MQGAMNNTICKGNKGYVLSIGDLTGQKVLELSHV